MNVIEDLKDNTYSNQTESCCPQSVIQVLTKLFDGVIAIGLVGYL